jgi:hypothetical protein
VTFDGDTTGGCPNGFGEYGVIGGWPHADDCPN